MDANLERTENNNMKLEITLKKYNNQYSLALLAHDVIYWMRKTDNRGYKKTSRQNILERSKW